MASLRTKTNSPYLFGCFTTSDGRRTQRSTKTDDRAKAERIANKWEDAAREASAGRLIESQARKVIQDIYEIANGEKLSSSAVGDFLDDWLKRKELETGEKTHAKYSSVVRQFKAFLGIKNRLDISNITAADIAKFRDDLAGRVSPSTVNVGIKIIRCAFQKAFQDGLVDVNEAKRVTSLNSGSGFERRAFTVSEMKRILEVATDEWRGMIIFGLYTGLRLGDLATLTWQNVDLQGMEIRVKTKKTKRLQRTPINPHLFRYIESLPAGDKPDAPLFPRIYSAAERHKSVGYLSNEFFNILVAAGFAQKRTHASLGKGRAAAREQNEVSFHSFRHTLTSLLKSSGASEAVAMAFVGHESRSVSQEYTHMGVEALRRAAAKLPDITK